MPELPEVEFARRSLERWFEGRELVHTEADPKARTLRGASVQQFKALKGRLERITRRGKYLSLSFSSGLGAVAHLGMTGKFLKRPEGTQEKWSRARFFLDSGDVIHFQDPRMFGRIEPAPVEALATNPAVAKLGVDPLVDGLTVEQLREAIGTSKQELKVALMDQERIAGLGNIHAAETLFRAKVHPARKASTLTDAEWKALTRSIHASIAFALEVEDGEELQYVEEAGAPNPFRIYGRANEPCSRCKTPISSWPQGGRTTFACLTCQPKAPSKSKAPRGRKRA